MRFAAMAALPSSRSHSPRLSEGGRLERKPSSSAQSHAHHRQTSIVNGVQHSRSGSYVNPIALSPQLGTSREQITIPTMPQSPTASVINLNVAGSVTSTGGGSGVSSHGDRPGHHSSRSRSHGHRPSHSHHNHLPEPRTTSEYALHILFTQVTLEYYIHE